MDENLANKYRFISMLFFNSLEYEKVFKSFLKEGIMPSIQNLVDFNLDFYLPGKNINLKDITINERNDFIKSITNITLFDNLKLLVEENQRFVDELKEILLKEQF